MSVTNVLKIGAVILMDKLLRILRKAGILEMIYTADFETTTDPADCRVWAWGVASVDDPDEFIYGTDIDEFLSFCEGSKNSKLLFHNLKFDSEFIICRLFAMGYQHITDRAQAADRTFTTLISDKGQFYSMVIYFMVKGKKKCKVTIQDSLKVLPFSVRAVAKSFGLPISKLEIDYHELRPVGHQLTQHEIDYLRNDVTIMALALQQLYKAGMTAMTTASNALKDYKKTLGQFKFDKVFPVPEYDAEIRESYRGGFTWLNPRYKNKDMGRGIVLDVNSLYPFVMMSPYKMPYGEPRHYTGQYQANRLYSLYVQFFRCAFKLKAGKIPTVQIKNSAFYAATEYLTSSKGLEILLCMTCIDLALFLEHYDVFNLEYVSGWAFKSTTGLFDDYINKWNDTKVKADRDGNRGMRTLAKLMLNSLYGKFALNSKVRSRIPVNNHGAVAYVSGEQEYRDPLYIPVGTFITSYARDKTIRAAQSCYNRIIYCDTDSLHLAGLELPQGLDIDAQRIGSWKHEGTFKRARYLRAKTYMEYIKDPADAGSDYEWKITCAGMPEQCKTDRDGKPLVTFENFKPGSSYTGKLMPLHVPGGIVLKEIAFTINNEGVEKHENYEL